MLKSAPIPVIDLSASEADQVLVAKELVDAAAKYGFVYVKNTGHDVSHAQVQEAFSISRDLFDSPLGDKQRCKIGMNDQGWSGMQTEKLDPETQQVGDLKEGFNFGPFKDGRSSQPIPHSVEPHKATIATFQKSCHDLCRKLLLLFGVGLGVDPPDFFHAVHSPDAPSGTILRFLHYPPATLTPSPQAADIRAGAHSDYGSLTLLFRLRGQAGLEILTPENQWAPVPVCPPGTENDPSPPILVNIGDLLSYWTNGLLRSTVHRVTFPGSGDTAGLVEGETTTEPRYSIVYFCHPADNTPLTAVPSERVHNFQDGRADAKTGNPYAERKVLTANEHLQMRLQASYPEMYSQSEKKKKLYLTNCSNKRT
ncbi:2OG-Fe(II) oxygenase superfamily protein [Xylariaceae sp. FL1272]|nr:2OG-Fe(II) oxygenase superfamily protein [Xylariaceae sp. FL1272]